MIVGTPYKGEVYTNWPVYDSQGTVIGFLELGQVRQSQGGYAYKLINILPNNRVHVRQLSDNEFRGVFDGCDFCWNVDSFLIMPIREEFHCDFCRLPATEDNWISRSFSGLDYTCERCHRFKLQGNRK